MTPDPVTHPGCGPPATHYAQFCIFCLRKIGDDAAVEVERLKRALGLIAELGDRCDDCEPTEAPFATHVTHHPLTGLPLTLCPEHAETAREAQRKARSKGYGPYPDVEEHEQDTAVLIALEALGIKVGASPIRSTAEGSSNG